MDFLERAAKVQQLKTTCSELVGKLFALNEYLTGDISKARLFADQTAGAHLLGALESATRQLETTVADLDSFASVADRMIAALQQGR